MAQLRQDYQAFADRNAEIIVVGPEDQDAFQKEWAKQDFPFVGIPDPEHAIADLYGQQVKLLKLGRMPALMVIDQDGKVIYSHYGASMQDIPKNEEILGVIGTER